MLIQQKIDMSDMEKVKQIQEAAKIIWDYHRIKHELEKADLILVPCSIDLRIAEYAAGLVSEDYAPRILFSGGIAHQNDLLATLWKGSEAEKFAEVAMEKGVPNEKILIENQAQNSGENIVNSFRLLQEQSIDCKKMILVQKPYMLRRSYATFMKQWPGKKIEIILATPNISFEDYMRDEAERDLVINLMVGDLQRIKEYPAKGFQIEQEIPDKVWDAFETLVKNGYDKHLIK